MYRYMQWCGGCKCSCNSSCSSYGVLDGTIRVDVDVTVRVDVVINGIMLVDVVTAVRVALCVVINGIIVVDVVIKV